MAGSSARPVLVLNCGSSSVKFAVLDPRTGQRAVTGLAERVGSPGTEVTIRRGDETSTEQPQDGSYEGVLRSVLGSVDGLDGSGVAGVGHRVVHGGPDLTTSVVVDDEVLSAIRDVTDLAPLHIPANVAGIEAVRSVAPDLPQVAVFDTAFHHTLPPHAYRYAVPASWYDEHGARRYGFHGTSHRYVSACAAELLGRPLESLRLVTAHLGNGCSATAVRDGVSVDTTMGLTPLEGLVMGTRSGDVDPGLLGYVAERLDLDVRGVVDELNTRSGLLGLSGVSHDFRTVSEAAGDGSRSAALALEVFAYRLAKAVAALVVPLGRLDALVFTGGIGENSAELRRSVMTSLGHLGLAEDAAANADHGRETAGRVSVSASTVALVVPTDEELVIARDTEALLRPAGTAG